MLSSIFHAFSVHVIFWECTLLNLKEEKKKPFSFFRFVESGGWGLSTCYFSACPLPGARFHDLHPLTLPGFALV
jgi:hypothetical protein